MIVWDRRGTRTIYSNLTIKQKNDSDKTILDIVRQIAPQSIFAFFRSMPTEDAPNFEGWTYTYVIIPIEWDLYMVQAYRAYSPNVIYQRFAHVTNGWSDSWFEIVGNRLSVNNT